jgi:hypothetical protein
MPILIAEEKDVTSLVALMDSAYRGENSKQAGPQKPTFLLATGERMKQQWQILLKNPELFF